MKLFYMSMLALGLFTSAEIFGQQTSGPNLLGAKGTFSAPFVVPNNVNFGEGAAVPGSSPCTRSGSFSYSPLNNIGMPLSTLTGAGSAQPASGYNYTARSGGLGSEGTYSLIKNLGDHNGGNCIKGDWRGQDHTGDGGWFLAVNGAPNSTVSKTFYSITDITVCPGTLYEFSAWVINLLPGTSGAANPGSEPNISFVVKWGNQETTIATSGPIEYQNTPEWVKVSGQFTVPANVTSVDLEVNNATQVAQGNDLGLDDISFNVVQSSITLTGNLDPLCENTGNTVSFTITDAAQINSWYKWQISKDGGQTYTDSTAAAQATFNEDGTYTVDLEFSNVLAGQNGWKYRLIAAPTPIGLENADCIFVNEYTLIVTSCSPAPVTLTYFNAQYRNGEVYMDWQTAQESNSDRFEIYKSNDGSNFKLLGTVAAAGNASVLTNYNYIDQQPGTSEYVFYRLRQVDWDGRANNFNIVKVHIGTQAVFSVYPNPFGSYFRVSFTAGKTADATMIIRNTLGQPVMQRIIKTAKGNNSVNIDNLSNLKAGVYYITLSNDDINYNFKLQKQ